jgi:signal transduction histidine kinase
MTLIERESYNERVKQKILLGDAIHLVRFAAVLWIAYLAVLAIINQSLLDPRQLSFNTLYYYILLAAVVLICLGLSYWGWLQQRLGKVFLPMIIAIITAGPMFITWEIVRLFPRSPMLDPQSAVLRLIPFLLVGFLLVAWQYKWYYMLLIIFGITLLNLGIIWSFPSREPSPFMGGLTATLIQTVVFLAVGFSISYLMNRIKKQQQSLEDANRNLTHYASTLDQLATTRERNRLARELHDTLAHTLSGLSVQLETIKAYWDVDPKMARESLERSSAVAHSGLEETRRALKALRVSPLADMGLVQALNVLAKDSASRANIALDLFIIDKIPVLSPDVEQCIYRVAQEAITNAINHSQAKLLTVKLELQEEHIKLTVQDDGIGFDIEKSDNPNHYGLAGMKERAALIGTELTIISKPGAGTQIILII